jgi:hypothetical protein
MLDLANFLRGTIALLQAWMQMTYPDWAQEIKKQPWKSIV